MIAPLNRPLHKCIASAALLAMIFANKYLYHLPIYRTRQMLIQLGMTIPDSTLESSIKFGADLIRPLYAIHRMHVFRVIYQMVDESPIKVQDRNKKGTCHQGYMWVRYAPLSKSLLFEYYKSRSTKGPIDDLDSFCGSVQTDGYSGYTYLAQKKDLVHLSCWAHARRYFEKAQDNDKERATHVLKLIQLLYAIEAIAREQNLTHDQRHVLRLEKSLPIINEIGAYIYKQKRRSTPKSPIGKAFYLRDEDVERIVDTFSKRTTIDKYSYVAGLDEVRENDYNLNIPRYVDTFEEEDSIDIELVANELKTLEADMEATDKTIAGFCKELNIPTPF